MDSPSLSWADGRTLLLGAGRVPALARQECDPLRRLVKLADAWVWLGAAGQATERVSLGSAVTAIVHRYNPAVVAQQIVTLEDLCPGRAFLGVGSGEAMMEVRPGCSGRPWPSSSSARKRR